MYVKERLNIPDKEKTPPTAEQTNGEKMFETLKVKVSKPGRRQDYEKHWIRLGTRVLID